MDLYQEIQQKTNELDTSVRQLRVSGTAFAQAERDYKVELRKEALKLRAEKDMPVTLIQQVVYGIEIVAELRFKRDIAEAVYQANQESINSIKLQLRLLESQLNREYSISGRGAI